MIHHDPPPILLDILYSHLPVLSCLCHPRVQGGILAGSLGARLPRNLQTHTKFCQHFTLFWRKFDLKVCISCQMKKFFLSHTTCRKYFLSQEETSWHCTLLISTGRNLLSKEEIFYQGQKFLVTRRNFLSQEEISCHRKKFLVRGRCVLSQEEISYHGNKLFVMRRNFMP